MPVVAICFKSIWKSHRVLAALIAFSLFCLMISVGGLLFDQRLINGEHAWIKPAKFSISLTVFGFTMIWFSQYLTRSKRCFRRLCKAALIGTIIELSAIILQVVRGTTSHFNTEGLFNHIIFFITVGGILPIAFAVVSLYVMLFREKHLPPVFALGLRWGLFLTIIGFIPGILMILPDHVQDILTAGNQFDGHTIGLPDGGAGLPFLGWSTEAGDLRVAHFLGIHALQVLPVMAIVLTKFAPHLSLGKQRMLMWDTGITYFAVIALLTWQALTGESALSPSADNVMYFSLVGVTSSMFAIGMFLL